MSSSPRSMRSDYARIRHFGSARSGTRDVWHMRLTAAGLFPLSIGFVWLVLSLVGKDYNAVRETLGSPLPSILMLLFVLTGVYHMQIGMRSIIMDYVHGEKAKEWSLITNVCFSAAIGLACIYAVLRIGFA